MKQVLIIHYNTPELADAAIRSLNKTTAGCHVTVFDNSDERPFTTDLGNVDVLDNTDGRLINFGILLSRHTDKVENRSNWGSFKHCLSVDFCMNVLDGDFVLMDSDVLIKKDISSFWDESVAWAGCVHNNAARFGWPMILRIKPYLCYLNVPMLKEHDIRYFNEEKMWFLSNKKPNMYYDTGAWLLEDCTNKGLCGSSIDLDEYALHFRHGSWKDKDGCAWLKENEHLWKY